MSWFSSSIPSSPQHQDNDREEEEQDESAGNSGQHLSPGKGVKEDFSALTKSFTRQLWGVASFLAPPPPSSQVESPKHGNAPESETQSHKIAGDAEMHMDDTVFDGSERSEGMKTSLEVPMFGGVSREDVVSDTSKNGSPKVGGKKLTGFRSDLAELRGSMATGLSKIQSVIRVVTQDDEDESGDVVDSSPEGSSQSGSPKSPRDETIGSSSLGSLLKPLLGAVSPSQEGAPGNRRQKSLSVSADHSEEDENNETQHLKVASLCTYFGVALPLRLGALQSRGVNLCLCYILSYQSLFVSYIGLQIVTTTLYIASNHIITYHALSSVIIIQ
jgi:hypothetical protein